MADIEKNIRNYEKEGLSRHEIMEKINQRGRYLLFNMPHARKVRGEWVVTWNGITRTFTL